MGRIIIYVLLLIGLFVDAYGWSVPVHYFVPPMTFLILIFWAVHAPRLVNLGTAFCVGILLDVIYTTVIGHHAFAYVIAMYIMIRWHRRIRVYPLWQQSIAVVGLVFAERLIYYWIETALYFAPANLYFLACVPVVLVVWPVLYWFNARIQQAFHLH